MFNFNFRMYGALECYGNEADVDSEGEEVILPSMEAFDDAQAILASCIGQLDSMMVSTSELRPKINKYMMQFVFPSLLGLQIHMILLLKKVFYEKKSVIIDFSYSLKIIKNDKYFINHKMVIIFR